MSLMTSWFLQLYVIISIKVVPSLVHTVSSEEMWWTKKKIPHTVYQGKAVNVHVRSHWIKYDNVMFHFKNSATCLETQVA